MRVKEFGGFEKTFLMLFTTSLRALYFMLVSK